MKLSMILILVWLQFAVPLLYAQDSPPFSPSWKVDYGLASVVPFLGPSSLPLGTYVAGSSVYGLSLADGSTLWNANQSIEFQNETYYAILSSGDLLRTEDGSYLVVSNYALTVTVINDEYQWLGFYLRDLKTGRLKADVGVNPFRSSSAAVLTQTGDIFLVAWFQNTPQGRMNSLLQLRGPDYSPDTPAALFVWPSNGVVSSSPPLILLQSTNVVLIFTTYTETNATLLRLNPSLRSKGTANITVDWRVDIGFSAPLFVPSQDESKLYALVRSDQLPTTVRRLDVKTGKTDWVWTRADLGSKTYLVITGDVVEGESGGFLCGYTSTYTPQQTVMMYAYCADQQKNFALSFNFSLGETPNLKGRVFGVYKRWLLVKEEATGDLLAYNPFSGTTKDGEEPKPEWKLPGQSKLQALHLPIGGKGTSDEYAIASYYPSTLARWAVKKN